METQRSPPPYPQQQSPAASLGPAPAPPDELARFRAHADITLPDLRTVLSAEFDDPQSMQNSMGTPMSPASTKSLPRIQPRADNITRASIDTAVISPSEAGSYPTPERQSTDGMTPEELQMREAAEALAGLGNPGKQTIPYHTSWPLLFSAASRSRRGGGGAPEQNRSLHLRAAQNRIATY